MAFGPFNTGSSAPPESGVYNTFLKDEVSGQMYALIVENGRLVLLGVSDEFEETDATYIDTATGTAYELIVESGRLNLKEV